MAMPTPEENKKSVAKGYKKYILDNDNTIFSKKMKGLAG
jgi:hypothetical protein